jgi:hypothetical protein
MNNQAYLSIGGTARWLVPNRWDLVAMLLIMGGLALAVTGVRFESELEDVLTEDAAAETLRAVISWGRYAKLFSYDDKAAMFSLENPTE